MPQDARQVSLSTVELVYLAGLLGADGLLGVEDPFMGQLAAEVEGALIDARNSLAGRGLVTPSADEAVAVAGDLAELVKACAQPEASLLLTTIDAAQSRRWSCFHRSGENTVEMSFGPDNDAPCLLTALTGQAEVMDRACGLLDLQDQGAPPGGPATLREDDLRAGRRIADEGGVESAESFLTGRGLSGVTARALADALAHPVANGSAVAMRKREPEWEITGFGFLQGPAGLWLLKPTQSAEGTPVEVVPVTGQQARAELGRCAARVWMKP